LPISPSWRAAIAEGGPAAGRHWLPAINGVVFTSGRVRFVGKQEVDRDASGYLLWNPLRMSNSALGPEDRPLRERPFRPGWVSTDCCDAWRSDGALGWGFVRRGGRGRRIWWSCIESGWCRGAGRSRYWAAHSDATFQLGVAVWTFACVPVGRNRAVSFSENGGHAFRAGGPPVLQVVVRRNRSCQVIVVSSGA